GPNLAQVPAPKKAAAYAAECRSLFHAPEGWAFGTCDQANLQDRGFAHYLAAFDGGAYAQSFLNGVDQHWQCAVSLGLISTDVMRDKESTVHTAIRERAKQFRYMFLFGGGALRAGQIIIDTVRTVGALDPENALCRQFWAGNNHPNEAALRQVGQRALNQF